MKKYFTEQKKLKMMVEDIISNAKENIGTIEYMERKIHHKKFISKGTRKELADALMMTTLSEGIKLELLEQMNKVIDNKEKTDESIKQRDSDSGA